MHVTKMWRIIVTTKRNFAWMGLFDFNPTRAGIETALTGDIEDQQLIFEKAASTKASIEAEGDLNGLKAALEIVQHGPDHPTLSAGSVYVASVKIGEIKADKGRLFKA